jgi:hypothetical protein
MDGVGGLDHLGDVAVPRREAPTGSQGDESGEGQCSEDLAEPIRRYEILLPLRFNDGQPVPDELVADTLLELEQQFGAGSPSLSWPSRGDHGGGLRPPCPAGSTNSR